MGLGVLVPGLKSRIFLLGILGSYGGSLDWPAPGGKAQSTTLS